MDHRLRARDYRIGITDSGMKIAFKMNNYIAFKTYFGFNIERKWMRDCRLQIVNWGSRGTDCRSRIEGTTKDEEVGNTYCLPYGLGTGGYGLG